MRSARLAALVAIVCSTGAGAWATPLGTAFTYQGQLKNTGVPASGSYDLQFTLYDAATNGNIVGATQTVTAVAVTGGLFTVALDFGATPFNGTATWLQIAVRPASSGSYTTLSPRQALTATPFAEYAANGNWPRSGAAITNANTGQFVGVNRTSQVSLAEYFGIQAPVQSGYGGMYIRTDGAAGEPFYGYVAGSSFAWTYVDGTTGDWKLSVGGADRVTVDGPTGNVGIGTSSPLSPLHVSGDTRVSSGTFYVDGPYGNSASSISAYTTTTGDALSIWNDGSGNASTFQSRNGNAVNAAIIGGAGGTAVNASTNGTGRAGLFQINNASSTATALEASTTGTGLAGRFGGNVRVDGTVTAHCGAALNRATPIAYGTFSLADGSLLSGSGNVSMTNLGNDTYRINVTGETSPASWTVVANVGYSDPVNADLLYDNIRVGTPNASGHIAIYAPCTSGCGAFTSQSFVVNFTIYKP